MLRRRPYLSLVISFLALCSMAVVVHGETGKGGKVTAPFEIIDKQETKGTAVERRTELALGLAGGGNGDASFSPWLKLAVPLDPENCLIVNYQTASLYSLGMAYHYDAWTSVVLLAGKGIGPQGKDGITIGVADMKKINEIVELFAKYYPVTYLFDAHDWSWLGVWEAGTRLGGKELGLTYIAYGDSLHFGSRYKIDFTPGHFTVIMGYSTIEKEPDYSLGVRVSF